jgi:hypothetical protein
MNFICGGGTVNKYVFYVDGLDKEVEVVAADQKAAHALAWKSLTSEERDRVACLDCIDVKEGVRMNFTFRSNNEMVELCDAVFVPYERNELEKHQQGLLGELGQVSGTVVRGYQDARLFTAFSRTYYEKGARMTFNWVPRKAFEKGEYRDSHCG